METTPTPGAAGPTVSTTPPAARTDVDPRPVPVPAADQGAGLHGPAARMAAVALPVGAALMVLSTVFDPPSREPDPRGTFVAYGADRAGADISATILHNGFALFGIGLLLAGVALAVRRGRALAVLGGLLGGVGYVDLSGVVMIDWYDAYNASAFGPDRAMEISDAVGGMPGLITGWFTPMIVTASLGPILLVAGLAQARALTWWALPVVILTVVVLTVSSSFGPFTVVAGFVLVLGFAALVAVALWRGSASDPG